MKKNIFILFILPLLCIVLSCDRHGLNLAGSWEDNERIITFDDNTFILQKKNANQVKAFRGNYTLANDPEYALYLSYTQFQDQDGLWYSLDGTDLSGYRETVLFKASEKMLTLKIIESNTTYRLVRKK